MDNYHNKTLPRFEEEKKEYKKKLEVYKTQKQAVDDLHGDELLAIHKET